MSDDDISTGVDWKANAECIFNLLLQKESPVARFVHHLPEVIEGHVGDGVCVGFSSAIVPVEDGRHIGTCFQEFVKQEDVLETAVASLAEEGRDSMCCVAHQRQSIAKDPWRREDGAKEAGWVVQVLIDKVWDEFNGIGIVGAEVGEHTVG